MPACLRQGSGAAGPGGLLPGTLTRWLRAGRGLAALPSRAGPRPGLCSGFWDGAASDVGGWVLAWAWAWAWAGCMVWVCHWPRQATLAGHVGRPRCCGCSGPRVPLKTAATCPTAACGGVSSGDKPVLLFLSLPHASLPSANTVPGGPKCVYPRCSLCIPASAWAARGVGQHGGPGGRTHPTSGLEDESPLAPGAPVDTGSQVLCAVVLALTPHPGPVWGGRRSLLSLDVAKVRL